MDNRVQITKTNKDIEVTIKAFFDDKKQKLLMVWIVLFGFCGVAILSQFFQNYPPEYKVFFGIYVAFWLFFEFKVVYAYRWRKYGEEKIIIKNNELLLIKTIGKRGITQRFDLNEIKKIDFYKDSKGGFIKSMNSSYWNINKYQLVLSFEKTIAPFAIDIDNKMAKRILNELRSCM